MNFTNGTKSVTGDVATAGIWSTYPAGFLDGPSAFGDLVSYYGYQYCDRGNHHEIQIQMATVLYTTGTALLY